MCYMYRIACVCYQIICVIIQIGNNTYYIIETYVL